MACEEFESRILDLLEDQLPDVERAAVENHLAGCSGCQAFAGQLRRLDVALGRHLKPPALSPGFEVRLRQRIQTETVVLSEPQRAERKRQIQAEYAADLKLLRKRAFWLFKVLDLIGYATLAALAGRLIWQTAPGLTDLMTQYGLSSYSASLLLSSVLSVSLLLVGLGIVFRPRFLWPRMMR